MIKSYKIPNFTRAFYQRQFEKFVNPRLGIPYGWRRFFSLNYWRIKLFTRWQRNPKITDLTRRGGGSDER